MAKTQDELKDDSAKKPKLKINTGNRINKATSTLAKPIHSNGSSFSLSTDTVLVRVGFSGKDFLFHESLLRQHSTFFASCFGGTEGRYFMEALTKVCRLEESDIHVFSYVNEWLYTQNIKQTGNAKDCGKATPDALMYIEIWKMADFLGMTGLMEFVMEKLYATYPQRHQMDAQQMMHLVLPCYEGTPEDCSLRTWISDLFAMGLGDFEKSLTLKHLKNLACPDFFADVFFTRSKIAGKLEMQPVSAGLVCQRTHSFGIYRYVAKENGKPPQTREAYEKGRKQREQISKDAEFAASLGRAEARGESSDASSL